MGKTHEKISENGFQTVYLARDRKLPRLLIAKYSFSQGGVGVVGHQCTRFFPQKITKYQKINNNYLFMFMN